MRKLSLFFGLVLLTSPIFGQQISPAPTGPFAVGRVAYHWTDSSRPEPLSAEKKNREIMVYVWYPAARIGASEKTASYLPDLRTLKKSVSDADLEDLFRPAYAQIQKSGFPSIDAIDNAKMPPSRGKYPVLVFSHGLGFISALYSMEFEDLASHGYVVAAIDHTYDTTFTIFPDGRIINFAQTKWDEEAKKPNGFINYTKERVEVWAKDTSFVINQLSKYNATPSLGAPFAGRLDLKHIGAFGHSVGGLVSARACQLDNRILACVNQDSDIKASPFVLNQPGNILNQPFLFFIGPVTDLFSDEKIHPTDERLTRLKMTRAEYDSTIKKQQETQNEALSRVKGGSYRILFVNVPGFTHRSFSDLPFLASQGDEQKMKESLRNFWLSQNYLRSFFDKYLKGKKAVLIDKPASDTDLRIDRFGPVSEKP